MDCTATRLPYRQTDHFSKIVLDYLDHAPALKPFYSNAPSIQGIQQAIKARNNNAKNLSGSQVNRNVLVQELKKQYEGTATSELVHKNIESLLSPDTFTITTAHQNNIFTGPLYFIYKIIHAIKLADHLKASLPEHHFVPVFYIGSEDADLEELNHIYAGGDKLSWPTKQTGAVGRMKVDIELLKLITTLEGQFGVLPFGASIISILQTYYKKGTTIQDATFRFINELFSEYGLVVLLPDNPALKKQVTELFRDDLLNQTASGIVATAAEKLESAGYKTQANPREINLFYLENDKRERIEKSAGAWRVVNGGKQFSEAEILNELEQHPERFSPNVILRGLYQEMILPNVAFIGGGGEIAYWLQLKDLFDHYNVPFPVLVLRNSFLITEKKWQEKINHLGFNTEDFFLQEQELLNKLVSRDSKHETKLNGSLPKLEKLYEAFKKQAAAVDSTLEKHVEALRTHTVYRLRELEKKMLRSEKRKFSDQQRQIQTIKTNLFPGNGLQERRENFCYYYAKWGKAFIDQLDKHSLALEHEFVILSVTSN